MKLLCLLMLMVSTLPVFGEEWKLSTNRDNIRVYVRQRSGSAYHEIRSETEVSASLSTLMSLLEDVSNYPAWMENSKRAEYLPGGTRELGYGYMVMSTPWPLADRDVGYRYQASQDQDSLAITIRVSDVPDLVPEKAQLVRLPRFEGSWQLQPRGNGLVRVIYQVYLEVGGLVPVALVNAVLASAPFKSLQRLREEVAKPRYRDAVIAGILEP